MSLANSLDFSLPLLGAILIVLAGYGLWLGQVLRRLDRKLERLQQHCQACRREVAAQLAGRLPYDPPHPGWWEAIHPRGHAGRTFSGEEVRIIGG